MHRVAVVALPGAVLFDLAVPTQVLGRALSGYRGVGGRVRYQVRVCAERPGTVPTAVGVGVHAEYGLTELATADTVVVPGICEPTQRVSPAVLDALRAAHRGGGRVTSICTGAFVLAAAGLLDGRRATTHWSAAAELAARYPAVRVQPDVLYVDEGRVLTSAGVAAGIDLCLYLVRCDFGVAAANHAARCMVVPPHRDGGQAQFIEQPVPVRPDGGLAATRHHLLERLDEEHSLASMAAHARMSTRTFTRRFRAETGLSPSRWLVQARLRRARELLEVTDLPVAAVAQRCGFANALTLREHFARSAGTTPGRYRQVFGAAGT